MTEVGHRAPVPKYNKGPGAPSSRFEIVNGTGATCPVKSGRGELIGFTHLQKRDGGGTRVLRGFVSNVPIFNGGEMIELSRVSMLRE